MFKPIANGHISVSGQVKSCELRPPLDEHFLILACKDRNSVTPLFFSFNYLFICILSITLWSHTHTEREREREGGGGGGGGEGLIPVIMRETAVCA